MENKILNQRGTVTDDSSFFPLNDSGFLGDTTGVPATNININTDVWSRGRGDSNQNYEAYLKFEEERRRYNILKPMLYENIPFN